jgi:hypothetical protein
MIIAIDYDGTYTKDKMLWNNFISSAVDMGHTVNMVTMRYESEPVTYDGDTPIEIVYTSRKAKKNHMENIGVHVSIWIDDQPQFIYENAWLGD